MKTKFTALGCHIYAGGFSLGVQQAGFKLLGHLEEGSFGVATAKHNLKIPVWQGLETWNDAMTKLSGKIDLLYGNPPCASWSSAGVKKGVFEIERWKDHGLTDCTVRLFSLISKLQPKIFIWECVSQVVTQGKDFLVERTKETINQGYHVYHVLFDAQDCGLPQRRKRFFFIASKIKIKLVEPLSPHVTVREALKDIIDPGPVYPMTDSLLKIMKRLPINQEASLSRQFNKDNPEYIGPGRPGFLNKRIGFDIPSCTITGGPEFYHPNELRRLSILEQQVLCGFPIDYKFIGTIGMQYKQVGKGVTAPAAYWLAVQVKKALLINELIQPGLTEYNFNKTKLSSPKLIKKQVPQVLIKKVPRGLGIGLFIRQHLAKGIEPSTILIEVHKKFPTSKAALGDILWNKRKLSLEQPIKNPEKVRPEREFDKTQLREKGAGKMIHRDYAAHFFRWGFIRRLIGQDAKILDVGCGQDKPLPTILSLRIQSIPKLYVGVDLNKLPDKGNFSWAHYHAEFNFIDRWKELIKTHGTFSIVVCFEVLEHMKKENGMELLKNLKSCCTTNGQLILSTPVFNKKYAAGNHLHEWTIPELQEAFKKTGWIVDQRYGTFASHHDLKKVLTEPERIVYEALRCYYDNDVTSCFLAPLHPDQARNNVWVCYPR